jgi:hypothetical protein
MNVYGGLGIGMLFLSFHDTYDGPDGLFLTMHRLMNILFNFYAGANYFITSKTALY